MSSLYGFSSETLSDLRKFRFASGRATKMQAIIYTIDKESYDIRKEDGATVYESIEELVEDLPDNSPRYVLLSYPFKLPDGRLKNPLVLVYWRPPTSLANQMLYAGAVEQFREKAGVSKLLEFQEEEDFEDMEDQLQ
ncbi:glia maturation factor beta [Hyphopichia burtonii NRRL Y-1933]|uniref:Glia maturation factor beta n=1 Tax=Hyphopichia burtonii NRRL Y-1933 TaxID=984485 RepID=A0A1E4RQX9_9ASCO|nr:glia maturation factor beta [Hyphopichia burtonii NRRL Y-1933]ODV69683.1 glia maturation factor beta [Hyphopichia burtonii NRRL Y-1933]